MVILFINMPDLDDLFFCDYLEADATYNNDDTLNDTALSVVVESSSKYSFEAVIHWTKAAVVPQIAFGGTATITNFICQYNAVQASDADSDNNWGLRTTSSSTAYDGGTNKSDLGTDACFIARGSVEINAGGTFLVRAAQYTADVSNTTVKRGSTLILTKMS